MSDTADETITTAEQDGAPSEQGQQEEQPTMMRVIESEMSNEERIEVGVALTDLLTVIAELEAERKAKNASYNANIGEKQKNAHKLSDKFRAGINTDERECPVEYQWETGLRLIKHPDTGETLQEDPISEDERQKLMPGFENQVEDGGEPEGELMPCDNDGCEEHLDGVCTKPDGDISCGDYEAPETDDSEEHENLTEGDGAEPRA